MMSCVLAIHNEEEYLKYSIPSLKLCPIDQLVAVIDRCNDRSESMIKSFWSTEALIVHKCTANWSNSCAESKSIGCGYADKPILLVTDADLILDYASVVKAKNLLENRNDIDLVCLTYHQYSLKGSIFSRIVDEVSNFVWRITRRLKLMPVRSGIYLVRTSLARQADNMSEYDNLQQKLRTTYVETKSKHLRPRYNKEAQLSRGMSRAKLPQYSFLKIILSSVIELQFFTLKGYLQARTK